MLAQGDGFGQAEDLARKLQAGLGQAQQLAQNAMGNVGGGGVGSMLPYVLGAALLIWWLRKGPGPTLQALRFELHDRPAPGAPALFLQGRQGGMFGGLLGLLGLSPLTTWTAGADGVQREAQTLMGRRCEAIPASRLASCGFSASRSPAPLALAGAALAYAALLPGVLRFVALAIAGLAAWTFWRSQRFVFEAESAGGTRLGIALARDALGHDVVDAVKAERAFALLQALVAGAPAPRALEEPPRPPRRAEEPPAKLPAWRAEFAPEPDAPPPIPLAGDEPPPRPAPKSVFEPAPDVDDDAPPRKPRPRLEPTPPPPRVRHVDETAAVEAYGAAKRLFDNGRKEEAVASWQALVRRWPETRAAERARKLLENRARRRAT